MPTTPTKPLLANLASALQVLLLGTSLSLAACSSTPGEMSDDQKVEYYYGNALQYYEMDELQRARDQVQRGLEVRPKDKHLNLLHGWVLQRLDTAESVTSAEHVFRGILSENDFRIELGLAYSLERKGVLYSEASRDVASGARYTESADPVARAAELRESAEDAWREAVRYYDRTLVENTEDREALNGLMRTHALLDDVAASLAATDRLLGLVQAKEDFVRRQLEREDISADEEARFRAAMVAEEKLEVHARMHSATLLRSDGDNEAASTQLGRVIEIDPELAEAHSRLAQVLCDLGSHERAIYEIDRFLRLSDAPFEDTDVRRAYELRTKCESALGTQPDR